MTQDPRSRRDSPPVIPSRPKNQIFESSSTQFAMQGEIGDLSCMLAAHGAGSASMELAFDLVLHEILVEAAEATRATGAAIAWVRGGEMVCRATTGTDAPELGYRVDVESGLGAVCINTGQMQVCGDVHADKLRNQGEPHRSLGTRSILFAPISASGEILGILQLVSTSRDAFREAEHSEIQPFIIRCIQARAEIERWREAPKHAALQSQAASNSGVGSPYEEIERKSVPESPALNSSIFRSRPKELSNSILLLAVLMVAVVLGLLIGWRKGSHQASPSLPPQPTPTPTAIATDSPSPLKGSARLSPPTSEARSTPATRPADSAIDSPSVPPGDLVISDAGEVVYRVAGSKANSSVASLDSEPRNGLVYRLDPEYPPDAIAQRIEGSVVLDVMVKKNGSVSEIKVLSGVPSLRQSATAAVRKWRFAPDDNAGERQARVTIKYVLPVRPPDP